ncbi:valine--tRNA ligase [Clostridium algidicarnis]|uniref:valine--tRNA ligase n=1 Tax=Clostridium algidicarnis TaxID=37659 RepID=UPI0016293875|nr:valine--tRNA ligase [Clostridium algidicarnis]MBB6697660.1 valine--tRNA ligase [Clostridium algidicarnis]
MNEKKNLETKYSPKDFEEKIYKNWEEKGYFTPKVDLNKKAYTVIMPPPNITGRLHLGHALDNTLQDMIIRFKRMQGYNALWLPGEDHASIATEVKVENELLKKGIKKKEIGRDAFLEKVWEWTDEYRDNIRSQIKKMGCSVDFTRESFTMDERLDKAVKHVFVKLYNEGLIYQGNRITNWCPKCVTAISDAEIEHKEQQGNFWHIKYPLVGTDRFLEIATTRPETMLGDTAVAVNPKDERYKDIVGKMLLLPLVNREIPIIADEYVDMEFGTGAVKITPAHDPNDYEVGKRHSLKEIRIMDDKGNINEFGGKYEGLERYEARKAIVEDLKKEGYLVKIKEHVHNVGFHDRCGTVVEPIISKQWYVKMESLAAPAIKAVKDGETKFIPERFEKTYYNWMENIQDWCISRQLWWGHRIPVWYCECGEITVSEKTVNCCPKCGSHNLKQDSDVLDTWFSSALWPFSTLGWPEKTEDLEYFYPTDTLVTGYDIIFFWVARMVFSGIHNLGEVPFKNVFIHGMVRDSEGRKMSKSLGNGVDPLEVIDEYGADALRFMLVTGNAPGNDIRFYPERVESARNFANKIWNASRFVMMNLDEELMNEYKDSKEYTLADRWILSKMNSLIKEVTENMDKFELGIALQKVYDFIWIEFCDWYIELVKPILYGEDKKQKATTLNVLKKVLTVSLQLLHPVMPFITEEIYIHLDSEYESITISPFPEYQESLVDDKAETQMTYIVEGIKSLRNVRAEMNVIPSRKTKVLAYVLDEAKEAFDKGKTYFEKLASVSEVEIIKDKENLPENLVSLVVKGGELFIPLLDLVDKEKELERLNKEKDKLKSEIERVQKKLSNEKFVSKAPESVVEEEKAKGEKYKSMLEAILLRIESLN